MGGDSGRVRMSVWLDNCAFKWASLLPSSPRGVSGPGGGGDSSAAAPSLAAQEHISGFAGSGISNW